MSAMHECTSPAPNGIGSLREKIDRIDQDIINLLAKRAIHAGEIGAIKQNLGLPVYDPARESDILQALVNRNTTALSDGCLRSIFLEIISGCRALQSVEHIAYLGPEGTFTHAATLKHFGCGVEPTPCDTIADVFTEVEMGRSAYGVVPIENSNEGSVALTMDLLAEHSVPVCGEIFLRVSHALLSREPSLDKVTRVLSHPQALAQCRQWLSRHLPGRQLIQTDSTAAAALTASREEGVAAVGNVLLAERYGLQALASDIQDRLQNATRFLILGDRKTTPTGRDKTSVVFATKHRPGMLHRALEPFSLHEVNITRIESRPGKRAMWEYIFFMDVQGHILDGPVENALQQMTVFTERQKILGSYPAGTPDEQQKK